MSEPPSSTRALSLSGNAGMAGPGGGPPRKSHTKSRKGCRKCKTRHIRCDENFPQCRNCTKHSVRCDYMDVTKAGDEPAKGSRPPELLTSPELQQTLDTWRLTGQSPFLELRKSDNSYWTRFSTIDLRLVHHITTLSSDLYRRGYTQCMPWTTKMSNMISVALSNDFTMNALLAFSATQLAWQTKNTDTEHLAYHHSGIALKALHEALGTFTEHVSEAVLATAILLSWQARDWQTWVSLQQSISTIMSAMRQWMHQPELARFLDSQRALARTRMPTTPSITGLPPQQTTNEDIQSLDRCVASLHNLRLRLSSYPELVEHVDTVLEYVEKLQQDYPIQSAARCFDQLLHLRSIIFWTPSNVLLPDEPDVGALAMTAHFYALALVIEPLFPECGGLYLGNMCLEPLEKICQTIQARSAADPHNVTLQTALSMLEVPVHTVHVYRTSHRAVSIASNLPYQYTPQSARPQPDYSAQTYSLPSPQGLTRHVSYPGPNVQTAPNMLHSYSVNAYENPSVDQSTSLLGRISADPRYSVDASMRTLSPSHLTGDATTSNVDYFAGANTYQAMPNYESMNEYQNRDQTFQRPPIIPSNATRYSTIPPPNISREPTSDYGIFSENMPTQSTQNQPRHNSQGWE